MAFNRDIRKLSKEELTTAFAEMGEPKFRAGGDQGFQGHERDSFELGEC